MKNYRLRIIKKEDLDDCIKLSRDSWPNWWEKNRILGKKHIKKCIKENHGLVAIIDNKVNAFLIWDQLWNKIHLQDIHVEKRYQRKMIGKRLLEKMIKIGKKEGLKGIISDCDIKNKVSILFHIKNKFKKCGYIKKNWDNEDSFVFSRKI